MQILVFHDAGEECDDQIALWKLTTELSGATIYAVMCGISREIQQERLTKWQSLYSLFDNKKNKLVDILLCDFQETGYFDAILQIAPLFGFDSDLIKTNKYVLMGTVDDSVNCPKGSSDLFRRFKGLEGTIVVESDYAAKVRPTKYFISGIPKVLLDEMISVGFRLALCRCDPEQVYAEGLINGNVGRGSNYTTVFNMFNAVKSGLKDIPTEHEFINPDIEKYIESLAVKKSPDVTRSLMYSMYHALDTIFGFKVPVITGSKFKDFLVSDEGIKAFTKFQEVALEHPEVLNPLYDYCASCVLLKSFNV